MATMARLTAMMNANPWLAVLSRAVMAANDGIMIVESVGGVLRTAFVNAAFERITGYASAEVVGKRPGMLHCMDAAQPALRDLKHAIAEERAITVVLRNYRKNGDLFWNELSVVPVHDDGGCLCHFVGILKDITAQKNAERELMSWVMRLDALTTMSADGLVTFDRAGVLSYANNAFYSLTGITEVDVRGIDLAGFDRLLANQCAPGQVYPAVGESLVTDGEGGKANATNPCPNSVCELRLARPSNRILVRTVRRDNHGNTLLYLSDVTWQRRLDEMKSEFLATAAHELRTPMASILGYAELLLIRNYDDKTRTELLEIILRQARRSSGLVNELLDLARIEAGGNKDFEIQRHDLRDVVAEVVAALSGTYPQVSNISFDHAAPAMVDKEKIYQVLSNLVSNAVKFSADEQPVVISMQVRNGAVLDEIGITIADQGIGMTPEQQARFGERFYRADPSGSVPGTGLGAALCKEIIAHHGGTLELQSEFGKGSCLTIWLPKAMPIQQSAASLSDPYSTAGLDEPANQTLANRNATTAHMP
jgi:PAS domain S-box-containing protein